MCAQCVSLGTITHFQAHACLYIVVHLLVHTYVYTLLTDDLDGLCAVCVGWLERQLDLNAAGNVSLVCGCGHVPL